MEIVKQIIPRLIALILIVAGILTGRSGLYFLLLSGIILGFYYGWFNDLIWRPNGKLETSIPYRAHQIWIHIICSEVGAVAFYLLLSRINNSLKFVIVRGFNLSDFILFLIAILGYTGLLPRILWYFTYAQQKLK